MVIDEFYQRACHVTLGSHVTKLHSALERNLAHLTRRIFPSLPPPPFPRACARGKIRRLGTFGLGFVSRGKNDYSLSSFHHEFRRERKPDFAEEESVGLLKALRRGSKAPYGEVCCKFKQEKRASRC